MSDVSRRKVDGNDVFLLPNRRIRPNSTKMSTILLNFVDQSSIAFGDSKSRRGNSKSGHCNSKKRTRHPKKAGAAPKNTPLPTKSPSGDNLRRGGFVNQL